MVRNDEIQARLLLAGPRRTFEKREIEGPADKVISGSRRIPVRVR